MRSKVKLYFRLRLLISTSNQWTLVSLFFISQYADIILTLCSHWICWKSQTKQNLIQNNMMQNCIKKGLLSWKFGACMLSKRVSNPVYHICHAISFVFQLQKVFTFHIHWSHLFASFHISWSTNSFYFILDVSMWRDWHRSGGVWHPILIPWCYPFLR